MRDENIFRIGSNTKQFAAVSILKLVDSGRLSLIDPLSKFLPDYPNGAHITVHELLNHTSGIKDYLSIEGYFASAIRQDVDTAKLIGAFKNQAVDFAPGTDWKYSNSDYILIGAILEKLTGKSWHEAISELVLTPLALKHTSYDSEQAILSGRVAGYSVDEAGHERNAPYISMTQAGAAGGLVSNVDDLFHWMRAVHGGKVLGAESYRRFITPVPTPSGEPSSYGYGIETHKVRGLRTLEHAGRDPGFMSYTLYIPDSSISVVALANTDSPPYDISVLTYKLAASALGKPYPKRHSIELTATQMRGLSGVYQQGEVDGSLPYAMAGSTRSGMPARRTCYAHHPAANFTLTKCWTISPSSGIALAASSRLTSFRTVRRRRIVCANRMSGCQPLRHESRQSQRGLKGNADGFRCNAFVGLGRGFRDARELAVLGSGCRPGVGCSRMRGRSVGSGKYDVRREPVAAASNISRRRWMRVVHFPFDLARKTLNASLVHDQSWIRAEPPWLKAILGQPFQP